MKSEDNYFKIILNKPKSDKEEVRYEKESVNFNDKDYAIVRAFSKDPKYTNKVWMGIIDKNYQTIYEFNICNIVDMGNNHLFIQKREKKKEYNYHIIYDDNNFREAANPVLGTIKKKLTNNLLVATSFFRDDEKPSVYDIEKEAFILSFINEIDDFKYYNGKRLALAKKSLNPNYKTSLTTNLNVYFFLDDKGNINPTIYNPLTNAWEDNTNVTSAEALELYIFKLGCMVPKDETKEEIINKLIKIKKK